LLLRDLDGITMMLSTQNTFPERAQESAHQCTAQPEHCQLGQLQHDQEKAASLPTSAALHMLGRV
jgi:hypothetical protein